MKRSSPMRRRPVEHDLESLYAVRADESEEDRRRRLGREKARRRRAREAGESVPWQPRPTGRKAPIQRNRIVQLRPGQAVPTEPPRRYIAGHGYVRLRWRVGPHEYLETYEHRVIDGRVTTAEHVHHRNRNRSDNRPENLEYLTADEHLREHSDVWQSVRDEAVRLYGTGLSTPQVAKRLGIDQGTVSRYLRRAGVPARTPAERMKPLNERDFVAQYLAGRGYARLCRELGISSTRGRAILEAAGVEIRRSRGRVNMERIGRERVAARSGGTCELGCGRRATEWHHRRNRSQGGRWNPANGLHLCSEHHRWITENPANSYESGWSVRSHDDPAAIPVYCVYGRVLLDDLGGWRQA